VTTASPEKAGPLRTDRQSSRFDRHPEVRLPGVALLTGGGDKPYVLGITEALTENGVLLDLIGSNDLLCPQLLNNQKVTFLNLRGDVSGGASFAKKTLRVLAYYFRLIRYAFVSRCPVFHILWNNKFELFDRTLLMGYYKLLRKKIVLTAHNVNVARRDGTDSLLNRLSLKTQYALCDHIFVHTKAMKEELKSDFAVADKKVSVIPFGINNTVPNTALTRTEARRRIGIGANEKTLLFFGNIAPYKGLEYLVAAMTLLNPDAAGYRLVIAGRVKQLITAGMSKASCDQYWNGIEAAIDENHLKSQVLKRIEFIPDEETELYFKVADVFVLPYASIFQSGVLFLGYSFGLPVIATDVGSLKEEIIEGKTGFTCLPKDPRALANAIESYFSSDLYKNLETRRREIKEYANERFSWSKVAETTTNVYSSLVSTL